MSSFKFNPNAGEWKPSFTVPAAVSAPSPATPAAPVAPTVNAKAAKPAPIATAPVAASGKTPVATPVAAAAKTATPKTPAPASAALTVDTTTDDVDMDPSAASDRITYSVDFLLQFQPICDTVPCYFPDVVRAPAPPRLGRFMNGRLVYSVHELLLFQPLYHSLPSGIEFTDTLSTPIETDKKAKTPAKPTKKEKAKLKAAAAAAAASTTGSVDELQYDPTLMSYFNPTEYAAALSMAVYSSANGEKGANGSSGVDASGKAAVRVMNPVEEAVVAKRRLATLLDDVKPDSVASLLESFEDIAISCTHTLQEVIALLFDRAIAKPDMCDAFAQLCSGMAERTPEFKEGAKTINFRRILLTRCYEALIEEPEPLSSDSSSGSNGTPAQHSWRRQCMLQNVCFIGELFRRQLLTENIMHVCVAMMLEDEVNPQMEVVDAACRLLSLVGDLLDGSSPASRRTMDEYFDVLQRLAEHPAAPQTLRETIVELTSSRVSGWAKKRLDAAATGSPSKPAVVTSVAAVVATVETPVAATTVVVDADGAGGDAREDEKSSERASTTAAQAMEPVPATASS